MDLGTPVHTKRMSWVQTDRKAHEAWARLVIDKPKAAALLHILVANMGAQNAIVISQGLLSKMTTWHVRTVKRAI